ncbi:hypothetical protein Leryth_016490 [Lithospermum erythrorhizon]|nr:hypothetical protein Leryth_016490 [Lithospermum erythrorhizon]
MTQVTISTTGDEQKDVSPSSLAKGKSKKSGSSRSRKSKNKRSSSHLEDTNGEMLVHNNGYGDTMDKSQIEDDMKEPTMGEKLASLNLESNGTQNSEKTEDSSPLTKPPSADSVHVLLKQALHADDRALLIDCLFRQDEKIIANSVSQLTLSDAVKLLQSLVSLIHHRGAVLACALPWLRSLLLQHSSGIMSHESSLLSLNSLYQLIESRVSTFNQALQLSSSLDLLHSGTIDDGEEENDVTPFIYEDKDDSDEEDGSGESMETESDEDVGKPEVFDDFSDFEGNDGMAE